MGQRSSAEHRDLRALAPDLSQSLLSWWEVSGRRDPAHKPWIFMPNGVWPAPGDELDPYGIWIAEVMLQQTQLAVVLPYWSRWMEAFPILETLAAVSDEWVLLLWQGLGYHSRAGRLVAATQHLVEHDAWPQDLDAWLALPGVGRSTAGGILSSAFNQSLAILDGNVRRVLAPLQAYPRPPMCAQPLFCAWSEAMLAAVLAVAGI